MASNATTINEVQTDLERGRRALDPVIGTVQGVWWVGLGLVAVAGEQTARLVRALAEKGREAQPVVSRGVSNAVTGVESGAKTFANKVGRTAAATTGSIDERIETAIQRMGIATRADIAALENRIEKLKREVGSHERTARRRGTAGKTRETA
jgi:poly(hydroxyalkanoate) granule-associated protein